jgi:hypothetical protein
MNAEAPRNAKPFWLTACLIFIIFFLPLHFHITSGIAQQLTKECVCLHGARTQANLTPVSTADAPVILVFALAPLTLLEFNSRQIRIASSRAPPSPVSL